MMADKKNLLTAVLVMAFGFQAGAFADAELQISGVSCYPDTLVPGQVMEPYLYVYNSGDETAWYPGSTIYLSTHQQLNKGHSTVLWSGTWLVASIPEGFGRGISWPPEQMSNPIRCPSGWPAGTHYIIIELSHGGNTDYAPVTIQAVPPTVVTQPATDLGQTYATLNGRILDDGGAPCQYRFRYRDLNSSTWGIIGWQGSVRSGDSFSVTAGGLEAGATYEFRVEARNSAGMADTDETDFLEFIPDLGGVYVEYFAGAVLKGTPRLTGIEPYINHDWGYSVVASRLNDGVSARWTAYLQIQTAGIYTFYTDSDDGARFWLDDVLFIDDWTAQNQSTDTSGPILLLPGSHPLTMEWYENTGNAVARLRWEGPGVFYETYPPIIPRSRLLPRQPSQGATPQTVVEIDDFDSYTNNYEAGQAVFQTWIGGKLWGDYDGPFVPDNQTGARVGHDIWSEGTPYTSIMETEIVRSGSVQSMPVYYFNEKGTTTSEVNYTWDVPQDWTANDVDTLGTWVHGQPGNDPARFYMMLGDSDGNAGQVFYADTSLVLSDEWTYWQIPLSEFARLGVELSKIEEISFGISDSETTGMIVVQQVAATKGTPGEPYVWLSVNVMDATGNLNDPSSLIKGATIRLQKTDGSPYDTKKSGEWGNYTWLQLPAGQEYLIIVTMDDYGQASRKVTLNENKDETFMLEPLTGRTIEREHPLNGTPQDILDNEWTWFYLDIPDAGTIVDLNVKLNVEHEYGKDLEVGLFGPGIIDQTETGVRMSIDDDSWTHGSDTTFDDEAPPDGWPTHRQPEDPLSIFDGRSVTGRWALRIKDKIDPDVGTLRAWSLIVELE
ncbi:MAG: proprotein convertase P-domain-containing protein [Phycisphaerae bacterium]|nr:proprotein convertase P-domain-containing protein [Phycisphaerae bacterium]